MKKKIITSLFIMVALFTITGCGKAKTNEDKNIGNTKEIVTIQGEKFNLKSERNLNDLYYKENYVDFHTDAMGNIRTMSYTKQEKIIFEVHIMYDENRSLSELKAIIDTQNETKEQSKEVNGIKYVYYEYKTNDNLTVHHYIYVHKGKTYTIAFILGENPGNIEDVFMNNISFK